MKINLTNYYDIGEISYWSVVNGIGLYDIELISKSTGEVITWTFTEEYFDKFINELEDETNFLEEELNFLKEQKWWFL